MLKLRLAAADLAGPWSWTDGAWTGGESRIAPFAHPAIETFAIQAGVRLLIVVREHPGRTGGQGRFLASDAEPAALIASLVDRPLNAVVVAIDPAAGAVELHAGGHVTAPLFLARVGDRLLGDWDVADLYPLLPFALDPARTAWSLCHLGLPYSRRTMFRDVLQLTERAVARWRPAARALDVRYPPALLRETPRRLMEGADAPAAFAELFAAALRRAAGTGSGLVACEVSGGLDSGVAALLAARALGPDRVHGFGLLLPGAQKRSQRGRRADVVARAGIADTPVDADDRGPFARGDLADVDPAIPWGEYYREAFLPLSRAVAARGCDTVIRGIGGDEIAELLPSEMTGERPVGEVVPDDTPSYLTDAARRALREPVDLDPAPFGKAPASFHLAAAASAPVYMRRGVWPIYPYGAAEIVDFCRSLPTRWRADRMLQRTLLARAGLPAEVVRPREPESFLPLRDLMFRGAGAAHVRALFRRPLLAEAGLVEPDLLLAAFDRAAADPGSDERTRLLEAATIETVLRTWRSRRPPLGP